MELEEFLKEFKRYVMIGSRALGVNTDDSDTDIACLYDDLPEYLKERDKLDASLYFNTLPIGNIMLIRYIEPSVDIIIYENIEQLNIIRQCIDDLKLVPKCILKNKQLRCLLFEELMLHYGFKRRVCLEDDICI